MFELFANSGDPDQTPHNVASDLGLHCLSVTRLGVSSLSWFNRRYLLQSTILTVTILWADSADDKLFYVFLSKLKGI